MGDALTVVRGVVRVRLPMFVLHTAIGKGARYAVVALVLEGSLT